MRKTCGVILSVHLAELSAPAAAIVLLRPPRPSRVPGLLYAETTTTAPLGEPLLPPRGLRQVAMVAAWESDAALDEFSREHPHAARLANGWQARLQPLRVFGSWAGLGGLPQQALAVAAEEPVGVLTLGRMRLSRTGAFRRSAAPAESAALADPDLLAGIGLARPPRLVATFSLWRSAAAMRRYAVAAGGAHGAAMAADRERPFHRESAFVRLRPRASRGSWNGHDPLAGLIRPGAAKAAG
jgi:hypothetical protein